MKPLRLRILSALVLAPIALAFAWVGGAAFAVALAITGILIAREWAGLVGHGMSHAGFWLAVASPPLGLAAYLAFGGETALLILIATAAVALVARAAFRAPSGWMVLGALYAGLPLLCLEILRDSSETGFHVILWIFAVVWATDIAAFAVGRTLGGVRLAPSVSPSKTWSGAIGGVAAAGCVGYVTARLIGNTDPLALTLVSLALGIAVVLGDLGESGLKRHFGAKDTGGLIPGHGGVMDRVDGLLAAAVLATAIGFIRRGSGTPAEGVLIW